MNDTKPMEMIAENLVAHFLQRHGIFVAKPQFDQEGGDLLAMTNNAGIRSCRIQCKGRTVRDKDNNTVVHTKHISDSMVVCLFIDDGSFDKLNLFAFFRDDILKRWRQSPDGEKYTLALKAGAIIDDLAEFRFSIHTIDRIANEIMKVELPTNIHYRFTMSGDVDLKGTSDSHMDPN